MTYSDAYNIRTTSVKFNDIADALDGLITRQSTTTQGTSSLYLANPDPAWLEYTPSAILIITPHTTNAAGAQISVNGLGAQDLKIAGIAIGAGVIQQGIPTVLAYNGVHFEVLLQNVSIPTGQVTAFAGATAPAGWLLCDGTDYATADYPVLSGVIGTTYNIGGEAAGRFRVPDLGRRIPMGKGVSDTLGNTEGGNKAGTAYASRSTSHSHTIAHSHTVAPHQHTVLAHKHSNTTNSLSVDISHDHGQSSVTGTITVGGSDGTHNHTITGNTQDAGSGTRRIRLTGTSSGDTESYTIPTTSSGHGHSTSFTLTAAGQTLGSTTKYVSGTVGPVGGSNGDIDMLTKTGEGGQTLTTTTAESSGPTTPPFLFINYIIKT